MFVDMPSTSKGCLHKSWNSLEGWVGHALDPTGVLYDTLTEASIDTEDTSQAGQTPAPVYMIFTYNLIFSSSKVHDRIISLYVYAYQILSWFF